MTTNISNQEQPIKFNGRRRCTTNDCRGLRARDEKGDELHYCSNCKNRVTTVSNQEQTDADTLTEYLEKILEIIRIISSAKANKGRTRCSTNGCRRLRARDENGDELPHCWNCGN